MPARAPLIAFFALFSSAACVRQNAPASSPPRVLVVNAPAHAAESASPPPAEPRPFSVVRKQVTGTLAPSVARSAVLPCPNPAEASAPPQAPGLRVEPPLECAQFSGWAGIGIATAGLLFVPSADARSTLRCGPPFDGCVLVDTQSGAVRKRIALEDEHGDGTPVASDPAVARAIASLGTPRSREGGRWPAADVTLHWRTNSTSLTMSLASEDGRELTVAEIATAGARAVPLEPRIVAGGSVLVLPYRAMVASQTFAADDAAFVPIPAALAALGAGGS